jgi:hypothetical protein
VTNHRISCASPAIVLILSILTLGGFWLFGLRSLSSTCTHCGSERGMAPVGYYAQRSDENKRQYGQQLVEPPE